MKITLEVILDPPAPPVIILTFFFLSNTIVGTIDERGLLPGRTKFDGDEASWDKDLGNEKSFISLFKMIPVRDDLKRDPRLLWKKDR